MEAPVAFSEAAVRDEKVKVLQAVRPLKGKAALENTFRAQYVAGTVAGKRVLGYKDEPNVPDDSTTETMLAARLEVASWRWAGVPFYIRCGKRLPKTCHRDRHPIQAGAAALIWLEEHGR